MTDFYMLGFQFRSEGGIPILVQVLKKFEEIDSIQQRASLVIASLASEKSNIPKLLNHFVFNPLSLLVIHSANEETLCMAIRALHKLFDNKEHVAVLGRNRTFCRQVLLLHRKICLFFNISFITKIY